MAVSVPLLFSVNEAAETVPNKTLVAVPSWVPVMTTGVPPVISPELRLSPVTVGGGVRYVKRSTAEVVEVPFAVRTVRSTIPTAAAGETAVNEVGLLKQKLVAAIDPNQTAVVPVRFAPVIVTGVPPKAEPLLIFSPVITGAGETKTYWSATERPEVPVELVTVMSTIPAMAAGRTSVSDEVEFTAYVVTSTFPTWTAVTLLKLVPTSVMLFPPAVEPLVLDNPVTTGGRTGVVYSN